MSKITKSQKRKIKLRRKLNAKKRRREILQRRKNKSKPWEPIKMRFFEMPKLFRDEVTKEVRIDAIRQIGKKAKEDFALKYPALQKWFEDYDSLYILSFCAFYFLSHPEGTDPEADGTLEIYQHYIELLQAFALSQPRTISAKPLLQDAERLKNDLKDVGRLMQMRFLDLPEVVKTDKDLHSFTLRVGMMEHTIAVRNWAYPYQMKKVVCDLAALITDDYENLYGIDIQKIITILFELAYRSEDFLNAHITKLRSYSKKGSCKEMIKAYREAFPHVIEMDDQQIDEMWKMCGKNLKKLSSLLMCHADFNLDKIHTFSLDDVVSLYKDESKRGNIKSALEKLSYKFGDLKDFNMEYFILDNPIHIRPFIDLGKDKFYTAIWGILPHIAMEIFEYLISQDENLRYKYNSEIKSRYLEDNAEQLFKQHFPTAQIYRGSQWIEKTRTPYENDLTVVIDTFALIIEAKSGKVTKPARRGAPDRLFETLKTLIEEPSEQAHRFKVLLEGDKKVHVFKNRRGEENRIDTTRIHYYIPLGVTLAQLGSISSNLKKMIAAGVTTKTIGQLAPSISLTDLELIFELLPLETEKIHYLARRREIEDHLQYEGDEMDLLSFYLDDGFNIGATEYDGEVAINMLSKSKELDPFFIARSQGISLSKPELSMTTWWKDILTQIHKRRPQNWVETAYILLNSTKEDQGNFIKALDRLQERIKKGRTEKPHNWVSFLSGPPRRRYSIVGYIYTTEDKELRNNIMSTILHQESKDDIRGVVIIGINHNRSDYPYSVLAGKLDTNLFDDLSEK